MTFPAFYAHAPSITLRDPLAELLGASEGGLITYTYADAVKLAGHSCPTVAGTWLMLVRGIKHLYGDAVPQRGSIKVSFSQPATEGVTGVMAAVATLITGATHDTGFKGLGGRFDRRHLLYFNVLQDGVMTIERTDGADRVRLGLDMSAVPAAPEMGPLLPRILAGIAEPDEAKRFADAWQGRVKAMLVDLADDPRLVKINA